MVPFEAPNGQRILLTPNLPFPFFDSYNFGIGTAGKDTISQTNPPFNFKDFYPANCGDGAPTSSPLPALG